MKEQRELLRIEQAKIGEKEYEKVTKIMKDRVKKKQNKELKERHPIYSFDAGKDDNTLEALYGVLRLGKNLNFVKESDSIYFMMCLTFVDFLTKFLKFWENIQCI